jgi:hypothetical protein
MRFMCIVKHAEGAPLDPPQALYDGINKLGEEAAKAGCVMVGRGGLLPTAQGTRITLKGGKISVTDGPFAETKEVIGGFAIFEAPSKPDVVKWSTRFVELHKLHMPAGWACETEIRQMFGEGDEPCGSAAKARIADVTV